MKGHFLGKRAAETIFFVTGGKICRNPKKNAARDVDSSDSFSNVDRVGGRRERKERIGVAGSGSSLGSADG